MNGAASRQQGHFRRLASRIGHVVAESHDATRKTTDLMDTPDRYAVDPDRAPDTYAEFLVRTAGLARHELAPAARRAAWTRRR
ncbi:MAG TPA: hypothetical protein VEJ42_08615 [Streptosporangiaceae bacterium]|nr:hypothetical protein [Streptosporangiaceae bacterium]